MSRAIEEIAPDVWQIRTPWANAFLMRRDSGVTLVDTGSPGSRRLVVRSVRRVLGPAATIDVIAVTHCHADHTANLAELLEQTGAKVYLPPDDMTHIAEGRPCLSSVWCRLGAMILGLRRSAPLAPGTPMLTAEGLMTASQLAVIPTPGHTQGHTSFLLLPDQVLFAGDTAEAWDGAISRRRLPCHRDRAQADASAQILANQGAAVVGFGHGNPLI